MVWRDNVNSAIKTHLDKQIAESIKDRKAYEEASNPGNAQLWVAVANLSKEIFDLNLKFGYLEKALRDMTPGKKKVVKKKSSKGKDK